MSIKHLSHSKQVPIVNNQNKPKVRLTQKNLKDKTKQDEDNKKFIDDNLLTQQTESRKDS